MTAISVTAANVLPGTGATMIDVVLGATVTAGQTLYLDTATNTYKLCDADASLAAGKLAGIAMGGGSAGQTIKMLTDGPYAAGGTVAVGTIYVAGATAGAVNPHGDLVSTWTANVLGIGVSVTQILVRIINGQVLVP